MIPGFDLIQFSQTAGPIAAILIVAAIIFAESGLFIGFFLPGDSVLFTLGFLTQGMGIIGFGLNIHWIVFILFIAATMGYAVGYLFGRNIGPRIFKRPNSLLFRQENVQKAQDFYNKHGGKTIIIARFIPIVRTFVPLIAGVAKMRFRTFMLFNVVGGMLWVGGVTYLGYFLGTWLTSMGVDIDTVLLPIVAIILIASISPAIYQLLKNKDQRQAVWAAIKLQMKQIFRKK